MGSRDSLANTSGSTLPSSTQTAISVGIWPPRATTSTVRVTDADPESVYDAPESMVRVVIPINAGVPPADVVGWDTDSSTIRNERSDAPYMATHTLG